MIRHATPTHAATLAALLIGFATAAAPHASVASGIPDAPLCIVPKCITLVGTNGGVVDPFGEFKVVLFDVGNNPMPGLPVEVDFSGCTGVTLGGPAGPIFPGVTVDCATRRVTAITDITGTARFRIAGGGVAGASGPASGPASGCLVLTGGHVPLPSPGLRLLDLDGVNGVNASDLAAWLEDFFNPGGRDVSRSDYDCSGTLTGADFSAWISAYQAGGSKVSAVPCSP